MTVAHAVDAVDIAPSVVTIGFFDGVHRGHQSIIGRAVREARDRRVRSVAVTFDRHPMEVVRPEAVPPSLQTLDRRVAVIEEQGIDLVLVLPFTLEFSQLDPSAFVERVLVERLRAEQVVVGANFRFGHKAAGDVVALSELGEVHGFGVEAVTLLDHGDTPISSTEIRAHLADGDLAWVAEALGRPFELEGEVVRGDGRGRTIGVPTANLDVRDGAAVPANGVYAATAVLPDASEWPAAVNIGTRPTFDGTARSVEAHLLDVEVDVYGQHLRLVLVERLRDERRFAGPDELVAQIRDDIDAARDRLGAPEPD